jgi:1-deoxyxylulose-5-phosphate synthase
MKKISLPNTSLSVAAIALGTADWGSVTSIEKAEQLYNAYRSAGGNCFDTAHAYLFPLDKEGASERALGGIIRRTERRREDVIVCTKGCHSDGGPKYPRPQRFMTARQLSSDLSESLDRLQMDYVDLYFLHRDDTAEPVDEIIDALNEQAHAGRIRYFAASNWKHDRIQQAIDYAKKKEIRSFVASQILFNLGELARPVAADIRAMNAAEKAWYEASRLPVFAFSSTANGYFAATSNEFAGKNYDTPIGRVRKNRCAELAGQIGATPTQIALAYLLHQSFPVICLCGTTNLEHLNDALAAADVRLNSSQTRWLEAG